MRQGIEDGAVVDSFVTAATFDECAERLSHPSQVTHLSIDVRHLCERSLSDRQARLPVRDLQREQFADLFKRETEIFCPANETHALDGIVGVHAIAGRASGGLRQKSLALVEADRLHANARPLG